MLFPTGAGLAQVEAVRRAWDPVVAAAIPAHITLAYPAEHPGLEVLRGRINTVAERAAPFRIGFGAFRAFPPPDEGCVYLEVRDLDGAFAAMRRAVAAPPFEPIDFPPHLTLIHPRTSAKAADFWLAGVAQIIAAPLVIDSIVITAFVAGKYTEIERFALRGGPSRRNRG